MTTLRTAAQQALEALESAVEYDYHGTPLTETHAGFNDAATALKAALAEPVQEPIGWSYELATTRLDHGYDGWIHRITQHKPNVPEGSIRNLTPVYSIPPAEKTESLGCHRQGREEHMTTHQFSVRIRRDIAREVRPEAEQIDGKTYWFRFGWVMSDEDPYPGEKAWIPADPAYPISAPQWIASGDLV